MKMPTTLMPSMVRLRLLLRWMSDGRGSSLILQQPAAASRQVQAWPVKRQLLKFPICRLHSVMQQSAANDCSVLEQGVYQGMADRGH